MNLCILKQQCSEISKSAFAIGTDNFCLEVIRGHEISVSHIFFLDNIFFFGPVACLCGLVISFTYQPIAQCPKQLVSGTAGLRYLHLTPLVLETTLKVSGNLQQPLGPNLTGNPFSSLNQYSNQFNSEFTLFPTRKSPQETTFGV